MRPFIFPRGRETGRCLASAVLLVAMSLPAPVVADDALPIVVELLNSDDRDTRGLALQQIREGLRGATVTMQLVDLLPGLPPEIQPGLLEALGDRGDPAARPALIQAVRSGAEPVRISALRALGWLGTTADVTLLAERAANGSAAEREAARRSLVRLPGQEMTRAMMDSLASGSPQLKVELLQVMAARKSTEARTAILRNAGASETPVRLAALRAAQDLAEPTDTGELIEILASSRNSDEHDAAEAALLAVSARGREACLGPVLGALSTAEESTGLSLMKALATIGGADALRTITRLVTAKSPAVQTEALRLLSNWGDPSAAAFLLSVAEQTHDPIHQALALRGVIRLAQTEDQRPANMKLLETAWKLADSRPAEQRLVLGALGTSPSTEAMALSVQALPEPEVANEAALACVMIGEKLGKSHAVELRLAMRQVLEHCADLALRSRAEQVLRNLQEN